MMDVHTKFIYHYKICYLIHKWTITLSGVNVPTNHLIFYENLKFMYTEKSYDISPLTINKE